MDVGMFGVFLLALSARWLPISSPQYRGSDHEMSKNDPSARPDVLY